VDAEERLARERPAEAVAQEQMERAGAERSHRQRADALGAERLLELRRLRSLDEPSGEQQARAVPLEPPQRERKCSRGGRVEPLNVVDGNQKGLPLAEKLQRIAHGHGQRPAIHRIARRVLEEQRHLERAPARR
jgi:hypothetical protein